MGGTCSEVVFPSPYPYPQIFQYHPIPHCSSHMLHAMRAIFPFFPGEERGQERGDKEQRHKDMTRKQGPENIMKGQGHEKDRRKGQETKGRSDNMKGLHRHQGYRKLHDGSPFSFSSTTRTSREHCMSRKCVACWTFMWTNLVSVADSASYSLTTCSRYVSSHDFFFMNAHILSVLLLDQIELIG